ncbi:hypothetical protein C1J05_05495 [Sulfitobacter sp. JL08]|nr:hypothetical protein C1J05_05495 [Sulfitobacter sp. JL08]
MKAIAEYFRDLAADDRYFGAEPPQPDAEMLARIAQREITRRVEAHSENGGIVLRAKDDADAQPAAKAAAIAAPVAAATAEQAVAKAEPAQEQDQAEAEVAADEDVSEPVIETTEEVAEVEAVEGVEETSPVKEEITVVEEEITMVEQEITVVEEETVTEDAVEEERVEAEAAEDHAEDSDDEETAFGAEDYAAVSESLESLDDETAEDAAEDIVTEVVETPAPAPAPEVKTSSIADKLRRIRAVVSRSEKATPDDTYLEDEHAEEVAEDDTVTESVIASVSAPEVVTVAEPDLSDEDDDDAADTADTHSNLFMDDDEDQDEASGPDMETEAYDDNEDYDDDESPLRARVLKVNRADLEAAIAEGDLEEIDENDVADASDDQDTTLSDEEEAELQRELAEVEASVEDDDADEDTAAEQAHDQDEDHGHAGAKVLSENTDADEDLSRLMAETEQQMGEPEGSQRRDAFAHLRAAVAATKAEETLGTGGKDKDSADAYRDDLASVVKPRRPETSGSRTERPSTDARPAPLKLVAEQRIDVEDGETRGPVRPRRVATNVLQSGSVTVEEETDDFVEFAENVGATRLPEVIEAAAAFIAYVEGREQFSRPQLMGKVRQVEKDGYSREDGLRAFGLLLRSGKIEKIKGGRFIVSDKIGFKPEAHRARDVG